MNEQINMFESVVSKQLAHIHSMQIKVRNFESKLEKNDMLDS